MRWPWTTLRGPCFLTVPDEMAEASADRVWDTWRKSLVRECLPAKSYGIPLMRANVILAWQYDHATRLLVREQAHAQYLTNCRVLIDSCQGPYWLREQRMRKPRLAIDWLNKHGLAAYWSIAKTQAPAGTIGLAAQTSLQEDSEQLARDFARFLDNGRK